MRIYVDIETTGLSPDSGARVIEFAAIGYNDQDELMFAFESLVNPGREAMDYIFVCEALAINGIPVEDIEAARDEKDVAGEFNALISKIKEPFTIHSYNVRFDMKFLADPPWNLLEPLWGECVMKASTESMGRATPTKLYTAAKFFEVDVEECEPHRAFDDAKTAAKIHMAIRQGRAAK